MEIRKKRTLASCLVGLILHPRQRLGNPSKQIFDVMSDLGAGFDEHEVVGLGFLFALLCCDFALVVQVGLVTNQHDDHVVSSLASHVIDPFSGILKRLCIFGRC